MRLFTDIALDATGDLETSTGDLRLLNDIDAVLQDLTIRLRFFKGEWILNTEEGLPYYQEIFIKNPKTNSLRSLFTSAILSTPLVTELNDLLISYDGPTRKLSLSFSVVVVIDGESTTLDYNKVFVI